MGVIVWLIPQLFFAKVLFQDQRARFAKQAMQRVYRAEAIKLVLTAGLFALVFAWLVVVPKAFFMGYLVAFGLSWLAPWCFKYENK